LSGSSSAAVIDMSIAVLKQQIGRFLVTDSPEILSIKGAWGVGKTYAWNRYLESAKKQNRIALAKYSYVSLFGINSLAELKFAIFENMIERRAIGSLPTIDSFKSNTSDLHRTFGKKKLSFIPAGGGLDNNPFMLNSLAFLALERTLICIDDFERKGSAISAQDILGLLSQLKEQKNCKIVLILNDERLGDDSSADYNRLREKVIDTEVRFAPSSQDCVDIALQADKIGTLLSAYIIKLKISNIRIIKKIERLARVLAAYLQSSDTPVLDRALKTLTLLTWCYYSQAGDAPDYTYVLRRNSAFSDLDEQAVMSTQQQRWNAILRDYGNYALDDFDLQIAYLVENGHVAEKELMNEAMLWNEQYQLSHTNLSFQEAWDKFNESFDDNTQEVIDCLSGCFSTQARHINPVNLDGAVRLLRFLNKDKLASKIIDTYIQKRAEEVDLFNLSNYAPGELRDREVISKFKQLMKRARSQQTMQELCDILLQKDENVEQEEIRLARAEVSEFVRLFKEQRGPKLTQYIDLCLRYNHLSGVTDAQKMITDKATAALQEIGRESKLNASRVRRFGIRVD
jgi:hypothetical protein